jgi:hypothetical protein
MGLWRTLLQIIAISYEAEKPKEMEAALLTLWLWSSDTDFRLSTSRTVTG